MFTCLLLFIEFLQRVCFYFFKIFFFYTFTFFRGGYDCSSLAFVYNFTPFAPPHFVYNFAHPLPSPHFAHNFSPPLYIMLICMPCAALLLEYRAVLERRHPGRIQRPQERARIAAICVRRIHARKVCAAWGSALYGYRAVDGTGACLDHIRRHLMNFISSHCCTQIS